MRAFGSIMLAISPRRCCSRRTDISSRIRAWTSSCRSLSSASRRASRVPIVFVPLNIMCSKRWAIPVMPGRSLALPTRASQPKAMVGCS